MSLPVILVAALLSEEKLELNLSIQLAATLPKPLLPGPVGANRETGAGATY
jgi:hypothetical protein